MFTLTKTNAISRTLLLRATWVLLVGVIMVCVRQPLAALACPFCTAINLTFTEQLASKDIAVVAKLLKLPKPVSDPDSDLPKAALEITRVLKGDKYVEVGMKFNVTVVGTYPLGQEFLVMGVDPPDVSWTTPMKVSDRVFAYLEAIQELPEKGADRLVFFQDYFEDEESVLAFDAYDEFAKAPYEEMLDLKDRMSADKLLGWVKDPETSPNRRRLYMTMLGICGGSAEADVLESFIKSGDRRKQAGLDALLASYLTLRGADGLQLVADTFLKDQEVEYVDTLAAVSALRFHGTEVETIPRERIVEAVRHVLDRPKMADMVIPDLARWKDWSVMDRLVKMFKDADDDTNWLRVPVITYLRECPLPEAKAYITELEEIDPDAVRQAEFFAQSLDGFGDDDDSDEDDAEAVGEEVEDQESPAAVEPAESTGRLDVADGESAEQYISTINEQGFASDAAGEPKKHVVRRVPTEPVTVTRPLPTNPDARTFVATTVRSDVATQPNASQVAKTLPGESQTPVAAVVPVYNLTLSIIFIPMAVSLLVLVVLWSVVSGWFERLIF